ncbi:MAG TPA: selenide, water dikinase SelD [Gemmatimonadaceae bacterium]|nr:selenide, water dikinase SelD [Gemmatimonadaceae bacterium]
MGPGDLNRALATLDARPDPRILVGRETFDDAGVFRLSDDLALVQTVDFFAPIVDDPYEFGQIAAANALSDVYAMGGEPLTALSIVGFPTGKLPIEVLTEILRGGQDKVHEAGAFIVGGHSIIDEELKYGLSVTGRVHPDRMLTNTGAREGDVLVLTKPLGTGFVTTALKRGSISAEVAKPAVESMRALNRDAARAAVELGAKCATDITGFGLLGHALNVARGSNVTIRIDASTLPVLPGALDAWRTGSTPGGAERNDAFIREHTDWRNTEPFHEALVIDPQTSGGLMVSLPAPVVADYLSRVPQSVVIGAVLSREESAIILA